MMMNAKFTIEALQVNVPERFQTGVVSR